MTTIDYVVAAHTYINGNRQLMNDWDIYLQCNPIKTKPELNKVACRWLANQYIEGKRNDRRTSANQSTHLNK